MTTTIPSVVTAKSLKVRAYPLRCVDFTIAAPERDDVFISVETSDLLAAVRTELGVLIIDKADLPEVEDGAPGRIIAGVIELSRTSDPAALRAEALRYLAAAEYLEAHPPVDEQQVEALADLLVAHSAKTSCIDMARALVATGKVTVQS